jgi:hypothetical protein
LSRLKNLLEEQRRGFQPVKQLLIRLASKLADNQVRENKKICSVIKQLLAENIKRGDITPRYIHLSLLAMFKRQYRTRREYRSLSKGGRITRKNPYDPTISQKGDILEIQCGIDKEFLEIVLGIVVPVLKKSPSVKIVLARRPSRLIEITIGDEGSGFLCIRRTKNQALEVKSLT